MPSVPSYRLRVPARLGCLAATLLPWSMSAQMASPSVPPSAEETVNLSAFTVKTDQDKGYGSTNSVAGSRIAMALREIPSYAVTINEAFLKDVGAVEMLDALPYVAGVKPAGTGYGDTQLSLRGAALAGVGLRDGLPDTEQGPNVMPSDPVSFDRVEVLKGPAGVLYGSSSMGGIINRVSKAARFYRSTQVQLTAQTGSEDLYRGMLDTSGPLGADKRLAYRVAVDYQEGERSWGGEDDKYSFYGTVKRVFGREKRTSVWSRFMYYSFRPNPNQGVYFLDKFGQVPSFQKGDARNHCNFGQLEEKTHTVIRSYESGFETSFSHPVLGEWSLRVLGRYGFINGDKDPSWAGGTVVAVDANGALLGNTTTLSVNDPRIADWRTTLSVRAFEGYAERALGNMDIAGKFDTGPFNHTLILNALRSYNAAERTFNFWNVALPNSPVGAPNTFSLINYARDLAGVSYTSARAGDITRFNALNNYGVGKGTAFGGQDSISVWNKKLFAVVGFRYDKVKSTTRVLNQSLQATSETVTTNSDTTHKYGLVFAPVDGVSLFASEATTYNPINTINNLTKTKFPNQEGKSREGGVKLEFFQGRLVATASAFKMQLTNVIINVVNPPELGGGTVAVPGGTQNTKGWETDIAYQPLPGLTTLLAFSNLTATNERNQGFRGVPQTATYSAFLKYNFQNSELRDYGLSVGYRHYGKNPVDANDTFRLPESDTTDLGAYYEPMGQKWSVQLNVLNVFDAERPFTSVSQNSVVLQFPRTYRVTMNYRF